MIDTRKQRLKGRAKSLNTVLGKLLKKHFFIYCGFSGADLDHDKNYLGIRAAATASKGFVYVNYPGTSIRESILDLIHFYGEKACAVDYDSAEYLFQLLKVTQTEAMPFTPIGMSVLTMKEKLRKKAKEIQPLEAMNMLVSLTEAYGDEITARYLYDRIWKNRFDRDYQGNAFSKFLKNYGRSFVFNFEDRIERAKNAGVTITLELSDAPDNLKDLYTNPARKSLFHISNKSPETLALIALAETYSGAPSSFVYFPYNMQEQLQTASPTELADIYYYYSFYAKINGLFEEGIAILNIAVEKMEEDCDEPRLVQLLSNRSMIKSRIGNLDGADTDGLRAMQLAEKYHDPLLDAVASLALATCFRKKDLYKDAFAYVSDAHATFYNLRRFPQFIECSIEWLKIILLVLEKEQGTREMSLEFVEKICKTIDEEIKKGIYCFEPEYCYLVGMIYAQYVSIDQSIQWFADAINLSKEFEQPLNYEYFSETCKQMNILDNVQRAIDASKGQ